MMYKRTLQFAFLALAAFASACTPPANPPVPNAPPPPNNPPRMSHAGKITQQGQASMTAVNTAAAVDAPRQLEVDVYQLRVPYGTISRNAQFWKRVDEQCVG